MKKALITLVLIVLVLFIFNSTKDFKYFPYWAKYAKYNTPIKVKDTNSSLGRYSTFRKNITLKDMALIHGHLCDGLVISYIELKYALYRLFPDKIIDRTDLRVVTKNGPCWVDACSFLTGARINFGTLSIDKTLINSIIVQKISTGETYQVSLKEGVFPKKLENLEKEIKLTRAKGEHVADEKIQELEQQANGLSRKLLTTNPDELLNIKKLNNYKFKQNIEVGQRSDVINK